MGVRIFFQQSVHMACSKNLSELSSGYVFRKDYICQHSSFNKKQTKCHNTKDSGCSARLSVKV